MTTNQLNIAILALNFTVGDPEGNARDLFTQYVEAVKAGATLVMAPELAISGYPPKDNLRHEAFIRACMRASEFLASKIGKVPLAFGTPWLADKEGIYGQKSHNSYVVARNGKIVFRTDKVYPAQGGVFDEWRVHTPGKTRIWRFKGLKIGFPICEDIWHDDVVDALARKGVDLFLVPNGSPSYIGKPGLRHSIVAKHVRRTGIPMLYLNQVGGQDEHAFDGAPFFMNPYGEVTVVGPYWQESTNHVICYKRNDKVMLALPEGQVEATLPADFDYMLEGILLTTRDYLFKSSSIRKVVIGVSGGVDSAVVLGLAVVAFGAENIFAISMPTRHNTGTTKGFAQQVCDNLGVNLIWWPIQDAVDGLTRMYAELFHHPLKQPDNAGYENLQSRVRGQILMAVSNREHAMLLSTGNKSEMAMGYATLYGDMNGGFNPLKTVYKTQVYELGRAINRKLGFEAIPEALITQRPSAELDDGQFDDNALPPYPVLDAILMQVTDNGKDIVDMVTGGAFHHGGQAFTFVVDAGAPAEVQARWAELPPMQRWHQYPSEYLVPVSCIEAVVRRLLANRFKRYQGPPGVTMTSGSFDDGEKYPLANGTFKWLTEGLEKA